MSPTSDPPRDSLTITKITLAVVITVILVVVTLVLLVGIYWRRRRVKREGNEYSQEAGIADHQEMVITEYQEMVIAYLYSFFLRVGCRYTYQSSLGFICVFLIRIY